MAQERRDTRRLRSKSSNMKLYPMQDALKIIKDNATANSMNRSDVSIQSGY